MATTSRTRLSGVRERVDEADPKPCRRHGAGVSYGPDGAGALALAGLQRDR